MLIDIMNSHQVSLLEFIEYYNKNGFFILFYLFLICPFDYQHDTALWILLFCPQHGRIVDERKQLDCNGAGLTSMYK